MRNTIGDQVELLMMEPKAAFQDVELSVFKDGDDGGIACLRCEWRPTARDKIGWCYKKGRDIGADGHVYLCSQCHDSQPDKSEWPRYEIRFAPTEELPAELIVWPKENKDIATYGYRDSPIPLPSWNWSDRGHVRLWQWVTRAVAANYLAMANLPWELVDDFVLPRNLAPAPDVFDLAAKTIAQNREAINAATLGRKPKPPQTFTGPPARNTKRVRVALQLLLKVQAMLIEELGP